MCIFSHVVESVTSGFQGGGSSYWVTLIIAKAVFWLYLLLVIHVV